MNAPRTRTFGLMQLIAEIGLLLGGFVAPLEAGLPGLAAIGCCLWGLDVFRAASHPGTGIRPGRAVEILSLCAMLLIELVGLWLSLDQQGSSMASYFFGAISLFQGVAILTALFCPLDELSFVAWLVAHGSICLLVAVKLLRIVWLSFVPPKSVVPLITESTIAKIAFVTAFILGAISLFLVATTMNELLRPGPSTVRQRVWRSLVVAQAAVLIHFSRWAFNEI